MAEVTLNGFAESEYEAALARYLARSPQAAAGFAAAMEQAVDFLTRFPEAHPVCDDRHRRCALGRYPYGLIYRIIGDQVLVVAVAHDRQAPGYWITRGGPHPDLPNGGTAS